MDMLRFGTLLPLAAAVYLLAVPAVAQDADMREFLFQHADEHFDTARAEAVDVLAPKGYAEALKYYQRAEDKFNRGEDVEGIRRGVARARSELRRAQEAAEITKVSLRVSLKARTDALSADAPDYAPTLWKKGEDTFSWAVGRLESGSIKEAKSLGADAEQLFREAELVSIKANYLTGARELLRQAEQARVERYAPKTLERAKNLLMRAELELDDSRYDLDSPREHAREAEYEASHAIYLAGIIKSTKARQIDLEELLLDLETPVKEIGASLDIDVSLDKGYEAPTAAITQQIAELRASSEALDE